MLNEKLNRRSGAFFLRLVGASGLLLAAAIYLVCTTHSPRAEDRPAPPAPHAVAAETPKATFWPKGTHEDQPWRGRLERFGKDLAALTVRGLPKERGAAHGHLLREEVRALVKSVNAYLGNNRLTCLEGAQTMKRFLEPEVWEELQACAEAAEVDPMDLLVAQLFGDVNRARGLASFCSSFAAFGPATLGGHLLVGRNFDYAGHGLEGGLPTLLHEIPSGEGAGRPFVTIGYAGILNGWTAMNADGLCACNNTLFGGSDSLEGLSTCFLLRKIVERGHTVEEGIEIIRRTPRACTTGMLVAGKNSAGAWDARFVEFDHLSVEVVDPLDGFVLATNTRQKLTTTSAPRANPECSRFQTLKKYLVDHEGKLSFADPAQNPVAEKGVYMSINLHCALLDPTSQRLRLAVSIEGGSPAAEHSFRDFRVRADRVEPAAKELKGE